MLHGLSGLDRSGDDHILGFRRKFARGGWLHDLLAEDALQSVPLELVKGLYVRVYWLVVCFCR
jgi:hypothetical protein